jgi:hypothetical protein
VRRTSDRLILGGLAAFVTLLFADVIFAGRGLFARDLTFYHWPLKKIVRECVLGGELPLWSRLIAAGQPLAANPAYEVFYPPQWLIFLPSYRLGFQLHIVLHLVLAACGAYLLLRELQVGQPASAAGAISLALGGPLLSTTTMLPFLFAWSWAPWIALFALRRNFPLAAFALAMQVIVAEPTTLLQTGAILAIFAIARGWRQLLSLIAMVAAACAVAAVQLIPMIDFTRDTVRAIPFEWHFATAWTLPWQRLIEWVGFWQTPRADAALYAALPLYGGLPPLIVSLFPGIIIALAALGGLAARVRGWRPVLVIVVIGVGIATGPLFRPLWSAHVLSSIRYPEKFILGPLFVMTIFGAVALDAFLAGRRARYGWIVVLLVIADLVPRSFALAPRMPRDYFEAPTLVSSLRGQPFRVAFETEPHLGGLPIEERYRVLRHEAAPNLPAADGVAMAVSRDYDQTHLLVSRAFEVAAESARQRRAPNWPSVFFAMSNVGWSVGPNGIQRAPIIQPRYVFATNVQRMTAEWEPLDPRIAYVNAAPLRVSPGEVRRVVERANSADLDVVASGPAVLVASVTYDRHWRAFVDGNETPIVRANLAFQALFVPPGAHHVRFEYRAPLLWVGAAITLIAIAALVFYAASAAPMRIP